ncbi:MAG: tetratricopeptide repeat protein [Candidatus Nitrospinota bacterium M3_3B_026]
MSHAWITVAALGAAAVFFTLPAPYSAAGPEEDYQKGFELYDEKADVIAAMEYLKKAADAGHAGAQALLGYLYDYSEMDEEAVKMYEKAAAQGSAEGEYGLGTMYAKGEGVERDEKKAFHLVKSAAEKGYYRAVLKMVSVYESGELGQPVDPEKSAYWKKKHEAIQEKKRREREAARAAEKDGEEKQNDEKNRE